MTTLKVCVTFVSILYTYLYMVLVHSRVIYVIFIMFFGLKLEKSAFVHR